MKTEISAMLQAITAWISYPLISLGNIEITLARIFWLLLIIIAAWWGSSVLENTLRRLASRNEASHC